MKNTRWIVWSLISVTALVVAPSVYLYHRPLGPSLQLKWPAVAAAEQNIGPTAMGGVCGPTGKLNVLLLGQQRQGRGGVDAIRLMVVDYDVPSVAVLAMPPTLWVETTALKDIDATTLTMAFAHEVQRYAEGLNQGRPAAVRKGTEVVAQALLDNFGYKTARYLTLNQPAFKDLVDAVGPVEINVPELLEASRDGDGTFQPGLQPMDGQRVLDYVSIARPPGQKLDQFGRFSRQNQVLKGIQEAILKPENLTQIPTLIKEFYHLVVTDLSPKELRELDCMLDKVGTQATILELTPGMVTIRGKVMIPDVEAIRALIEELQQFEESFLG
jgi:anionic cell wall polymer biosynthesis LytR-Cps2A-Psr (LCP) family protein